MPKIEREAHVFGKEVSFKLTWRSYQQRVLSELDEHLNDNHLHIVAAPGSGKTVLGLEVVRRLGRPALILAPTLTIRQQWMQRFVDLFLPKDFSPASYLSNDLKRPALLTISTYQGLHGAYAGGAGSFEDDEAEEETTPGKAFSSSADRPRSMSKGHFDLIQTLSQTGVGTIVVDEAHHLKNEWWKSLVEVKKRLNNPTVVALTATPPLDVTYAEWERYKKLCGSIDSVISVPELVYEKNLCPHQDVLYLSYPSDTESEIIETFRSDTKHFLDRLKSDKRIIQALTADTRIREPHRHVEDILSDPGYHSSVAFFLHHAIGKAPIRLLKLIGFDTRLIPPFDGVWAEILLTGFLGKFADRYQAHQTLIHEFSQTLRRMGALERNTVQFQTTDHIKKLLVSSISKLESILRIVAIESTAMGNRLRQVVLTDYIRKAELPSHKDDLRSLDKMGVVPIFEKLRRERSLPVRLGVLSGRLVIVPVSSTHLVYEAAQELSIARADIEITALNHDPRYAQLSLKGESRSSTVRLITHVFTRGGITVLIGTKALLGEGWDAPSINSLVLASFVGSYVLSNQMRGRAIRTFSAEPEKTANIWHVASVERNGKQLGDDLDMLRRRFKSFEGVSFTEPAIENGMDRLAVGDPPFDAKRLASVNAFMEKKAVDREGLRKAWDEAFKARGAGGRMIEEIRTPDSRTPRKLVFSNTIFALAWQGFAWGGYVTLRNLGGVRGVSSYGELAGLLAAAFLLGAVAAAPRCLKAVWLWAKHGSVTASLEQMGKAVLKSLIQAALIRTSENQLRIRTEKGTRGTLTVHLDGGSLYETSRFLDALQELLEPIENPRYIVTRGGLSGRFFRQDYHAVPQEIAKNKKRADYFSKMWKTYVGPAKLIYTRTAKGRQILLRARACSLSAALTKQSERVSQWK